MSSNVCFSEGSGPFPPRVVVVDDSEAIRELLKRVMAAEGIRCAAFPSAVTAFEFLSAHETDALVLDVEMPGLSGPEFAAALRKRALWSCLPICLIAAHPFSLPALGQDRGRFCWLRKPFRPRELLACLRELLEGAGDRVAPNRRAGCS